MALSMDEQRILEEIERRLADEDPGLAARLTAFGHPGFAFMLRSRRGRMIASLIALVTLAVISVAAYTVIPLSMRHAPKPRPAPASSQSTRSTQATQPVISDPSAGRQAPSAPTSAAQRGAGVAADPSASRSDAKPAH